MICARGGNDTIYGLGGDDLIYGGKGNDVIDAGAGNDRAFGIDGDDTFNGGPGDDRIGGGAGNDTIRGDGGDDKLYGASGDDVIEGGAGRDLGWGDGGDDTIYAFGPSGSETDRNVLGGGPGFDKIVGSDGRDLIYPSADGAEIDAGAGSDIITGDATDVGDLIVDAGAGNDRIIFGRSTDPAAGFSSNRTFGRVGIDVGGGADQVRLVGGGSQIVAESVSVLSPSGRVSVALSLSGLIDGDLTVEARDEGGGVTFGGSEGVSGDVLVDYSQSDGGGVLFLNSVSVQGDMTVLGGTGTDSIRATATDIGFVGDLFRFEAGGGDDTANLEALRGARYEIDLGDGDDWVRLKFTSGFNSFIDGGTGEDEVVVDSETLPPRDADNNVLLPNVETVSGFGWEIACLGDDFNGVEPLDDNRCP